MQCSVFVEWLFAVRRDSLLRRVTHFANGETAGRSTCQLTEVHVRETSASLFLVLTIYTLEKTEHHRKICDLCSHICANTVSYLSDTPCPSHRDFVERYMIDVV
jgi:hypothetical protein